MPSFLPDARPRSRAQCCNDAGVSLVPCCCQAVWAAAVLVADVNAGFLSAGKNRLPKSTALSEIEAAPALQPAPSPVEPRPIFAFLITWGITRHEPATLLKLAGAILGLAGTAAIIGLDSLGGLGSDVFAEIVILMATISFACATIFGLRLSGYDPMVVAAGSLLFGGWLLLPVSLIVDHPWTLHPTAHALAATVAMGIFSSALGLMLFYMCLTRLGTLTTNAQGYLRIPIGVGLSVALLGESVPSNLVLGLLLVMAGVAAMTIPGDRYRAGLR